jgi:peroxiredoxin
LADHAHAGPLAIRFAALQQERERSWTPDQLTRNAAQRRGLVNRFDAEKTVRPGDRLAPFELHDTTGDTIRLDDLVLAGPAVLIFFRYSDCPACNIALPLYDSGLGPALAAAGVALVAISPQVPERLAAIKARHGLGLTIATDPDNRLARRLGITFVPDDRPVPPPAGWIGEITGTGSWELPQPTVLIVDEEHIVRFVAVSPDWLDRPEASTILAALDGVRGTVAA